MIKIKHFDSPLQWRFSYIALCQLLPILLQILHLLSCFFRVLQLQGSSASGFFCFLLPSSASFSLLTPSASFSLLPPSASFSLLPPSASFSLLPPSDFFSVLQVSSTFMILQPSGICFLLGFSGFFFSFP